MLRRRALLSFLGAGVMIGCLSSPTLPLPPPVVEEPTVPEDGVTVLSGTVPVGRYAVRVLALNARSGLIFGETTDDNRFEFRALADGGDTFLVWYEAGDRESDAVAVAVPSDGDAGESN